MFEVVGDILRRVSTFNNCGLSLLDTGVVSSSVPSQSVSNYNADAFRDGYSSVGYFECPDNGW
jgi:hypothetical protein